MSKITVHTPKDFSSYTKEMKETIIKSIKEEYGGKVKILPYIPGSFRVLLKKNLNQNEDE